jgi:MraZ protein
VVNLFFGHYFYSVDHKGRVAIPNCFRKALPQESNGRLVLNKGHDRTISIHPLSVWKKVVGGALSKLSINKKESRTLLWGIPANANEATLDAQGRISIPKELLDFAGISKEVVIFGGGILFVMANPETFNKFQKEFEENYEKYAADLLDGSEMFAETE